MEKCAEGIVLVEEYAAKGSVMAVSDAGCAAALCKAALQAASLNVFINTKLMADRERAAALDAKADKLLGEFVVRAGRDVVFSAGPVRHAPDTEDLPREALLLIVREGKYYGNDFEGRTRCGRYERTQCGAV